MEPQDIPMLWIDIETTGLDQNDLWAQILEFGYVITDSNLEVIDRDSWIIRNDFGGEPGQWTDFIDQNYDEFIRDFHGPDKTDLFRLSNRALLGRNAATLDWVDSFMADLCSYGIFHGEKPMLHGSSVHFDRKWVEAFMPRFTEALHHRIIDLSSTMELAKRWSPEIDLDLLLEPKKTHRVDDDLDDSIDLAALLRRMLFKDLPS